jgi:cytochrome P450
LRKLFLTAFTPRVVDAMRPRIQQIVDDLFDKVQHKGWMEMIDELAFQLPVTVLCDILGVPHADAPKFRLKANREPLLMPAIEEILRFESPVARQPRLMKQDYEIRGKTIREGQMVFQMLTSANRDESIFRNPDTFDIAREDNKHIAFGFGPHFCIGASLSRMEGHVVFGTIMERMPNIQIVDDEPSWDPTKPNSRVLRHLHVTF